MKCRTVRNHSIDLIEASRARSSSPTHRDYWDHLQHCPECRQWFQAFNEAWENWDPARHADVPDTLFQKIVEKIDANRNNTLVPGKREKLWKLALEAPIAFALFMGALFTGMHLGNSGTTTNLTSDAQNDSLYYAVFSAYPEPSAGTFLTTQFAMNEENGQ